MKITRRGNEIDIMLNEKDIVKMKKDPRNSIKCPYCKKKMFVWSNGTHNIKCFLTTLTEIKELKNK